MLKPIPQLTLVSGMSQEFPAHMQQQGTWHYAENVRFRDNQLKQAVGAQDLWIVAGTDADVVTALIPHVVNGTDTLLFGLSTEGIFSVDNVISHTSTSLVFGSSFTIDSSGYHRWAWVTSSSGLYVTNYVNPLFVMTDPDNPLTEAIATGPNYSAKYLEEYEGHLVMANVVDQNSGEVLPLRVAYSDLGDYTDFEPTTTNEADFYELANNPLNSLFGLGITGLKRLGEVCVVYTPGSIWNMRYVGFDNGVMQFTEVIQGIGSFVPYGVVGLDRYHVFIGRDDFYVYDGSTIRSIGGPVRTFFFQDLTSDPKLRQRTWGYVDIETQEVRWYYPSRTARQYCDKCVVFNWRTKAWYFESGARSAVLSSGAQGYRTIEQLGDLVTTIDGLSAISDTIDGLAAYNMLPWTIFTEFGSRFLKREIQSDDNVLLTDRYPQVVLESGDYFFDDPSSVKEIDGLILDAEVNRAPYVANLTGYSQYGWEVHVSVRDYLHSPVEWKLLGKYLGDESSKKMTVPRIAGRIFRFKFISRQLHSSQFFGFTPLLYAGTSEK